MSSFWIQASTPAHNVEYDPEDQSLNEAVETVFPMRTECALLVWNNCFVALSYKYDVSAILGDVIGLLEAITEQASGDMEIHWPSNTFSARWMIEWFDRTTRIESEWIRVVGVPETVLNESRSVTMAKEDFVAEWREMMLRVVSALRCSGYTEENFSAMRPLVRTVERIPFSGILYR